MNVHIFVLFPLLEHAPDEIALRPFESASGDAPATVDGGRSAELIGALQTCCPKETAGNSRVFRLEEGGSSMLAFETRNAFSVNASIVAFSEVRRDRVRSLRSCRLVSSVRL